MNPKRKKKRSLRKLEIDLRFGRRGTLMAVEAAATAPTHWTSGTCSSKLLLSVMAEDKANSHWSGKYFCCIIIHNTIIHWFCLQLNRLDKCKIVPKELEIRHSYLAVLLYSTLTWSMEAYIHNFKLFMIV